MLQNLQHTKAQGKTRFHFSSADSQSQLEEDA